METPLLVTIVRVVERYIFIYIKNKKKIIQCLKNMKIVEIIPTNLYMMFPLLKISRSVLKLN